jgi:hypothetical protein
MPPNEPQEKPSPPAGPAASAGTTLSSNPTVQQPSGPSAQHESRPPGEVGGHTVQPWEQDHASGMERKPTSKDVPPPQAGAPEAKATSPGPGAVTTPAPGNVPSRQGQPGGAASAAKPGPADAGAEAQAEAATPPESASADDLHEGAPAKTRPNRPPVYSPQPGHGPAPRPPPSHQPPGPGTEGDRLVEAISRAIAENLGKAFHQSVAQAVREVFPLSAKSVDSGQPSAATAAATTATTPAATTAATTTPRTPQPAKGQVTSGSAPPSNRGGSPGAQVTHPQGTPQAGARRSDAGTGQVPPSPAAGRDTAAPESPGPAGSRPTGKEPRSTPGATQAIDPTKGKGRPAAPAQPQQAQAGQAVAPDGRTGPAKSMYGGTIEPPAPAPADKNPPGNAAAASADEKAREGDLA